MNNKILRLANEFLLSKKTKVSKYKEYRKNFNFSKLNETLEEIFNEKNNGLLLKAHSNTSL